MSSTAQLPDIKMFMDKSISVKINKGRQVNIKPKKYFYSSKIY